MKRMRGRSTERNQRKPGRLSTHLQGHLGTDENLSPPCRPSLLNSNMREDLLLLFVLSVVNLVIGGLLVLLCVSWTWLSPLSDPLMSFRAKFAIYKVQTIYMRIQMFPQDPCEQSEFSSDQDCVLVKGRLRWAVGLWREIHPPQFILDITGGKFCVQVVACVPLTWSRAVLKWTFLLIPVNTFLFRGHFRTVVL